jgi:hypothetical protein
VHAVEILYAAPCESCFVGKEDAAAEEGIFPTLSKILGTGESQADLMLVTVANGAGTATVYAEPSKLPCAPHVCSAA